jgi:hypothetical protein
MSLTTSRVHAGTRLTVSLHWRSTVEGETVVTKICMASSVAMMHVTESKIGARNVNTLNKSDMKKGTMITMVPIMTNLTDSILPRGHNAGGVKAFSCNLKRVPWPLNFKPSGIEKCDGSTNPAEQLEVYQLTIKVAGGDSYIMANYLPVTSVPHVCIR